MTIFAQTTKLIILFAIVGAGLVAWSVGVETGFFASPMFSSFWWLGSEEAQGLIYPALYLGFFIVVLAVTIYFAGRKKS